MTEDEEILEFRHRRLTWKDWGVIALLNFVIFVFFVGLKVIFSS